MTRMNTDKGVFRLLAGAAVFGRRYVSEQKWPTWLCSLSKRSLAQRVTSTGAGGHLTACGWPPAALASHRRRNEDGAASKGPVALRSHRSGILLRVHPCHPWF